VTTIGTIGTVSDTVSMASNGTEIILVDGSAGYLINTTANTVTQITDPDFPNGVRRATYQDGYFIVAGDNSQKFYISGLLNGSAWDGLDFASAEGSPDNLVTLIVDHREVWLFGETSVEVWYNAGLPDFPLARIQGAFNEIGCISAYTIAKMDNGIFWLGADARGQGIVYRANGYTGQRISTHAVEWHIQQYGNLTDSLAYTYQQDGHSFYVLIFPSANTTWVYDVATGAWHERAGWSNGSFTRHRSNCQMAFNNQIIVGDYETGNIYAYNLDTYADNGQIQKWLRTWRALPTGQNNLKRTTHHSLQIDLESGVGLNIGQGSDPEVMLRWSDDGGHTWSNYHTASIGKIGQFYRRVFFRRLGMTLKLRDRVYELSMTDPVKTAIMGAELLISGTNA